jgi:RNA polymerase sigma-70 factor (ECF subfamily)
MRIGRDPLAHPEELIRRVYAYCAYRLGDGAEAEDATSDAFERALRYRSTFDPGKGAPAAWLIGIARRTVDDVVARRLPTAEELPDRSGPERDIASGIDLADAVARLDERSRELIALRYGADLTARQIGELLGLRTNTVEVALHRALAVLRVELAPEPQREDVRVLQPEASP